MSVVSVIFAIEISLASKELWQRDLSAAYIKQSFLATLGTRGETQTPSCFSGWMDDLIMVDASK